MIADGVIKALTLANHKIFIEMIDLKDKRERLVFIKLEEDSKDIFLLCGVEQNSKVFRYKADAF